MSKIEDTNVFSSANATIDPVAPKDCIFGCGAKINYDSTLPGPSYREVNTGLHHSFKRCAELIGDPDVARQRFQELKRKRIKEQKG